MALLLKCLPGGGAYDSISWPWLGYATSQNARDPHSFMCANSVQAASTKAVTARSRCAESSRGAAGDRPDVVDHDLGLAHPHHRIRCLVIEVLQGLIHEPEDGSS